MNIYTNFKEYLENLNNGKSFTENAFNTIKNYKFKLLGNCNEHNYYDYADSDGILIFNNANHCDITKFTISGGYYNDSYGESNSIRYEDLYPIIEFSKNDLLIELEKLNNNLKTIENEKILILEKLKYLMINKIEKINEIEYNNYLMTEITK